MGLLVSTVALIPAQSGSRRVRDKNTRLLASNPLFAYAIAAAKQSGVYERVVLLTDEEDTAAEARMYGAETPYLRRRTGEPDFEWVSWLMAKFASGGYVPDQFSVVRVTSPFRSAMSIRLASQCFAEDGRADSIRAVSPASTNPYKMWWYSADRERIVPVMDDCYRRTPEQPRHSLPSELLPPAYDQNAGLEIAKSSVLWEHHNISGPEVMPYFSLGYEGLNIDTEDDFAYAEFLVETGRAKLPEIR